MATSLVYLDGSPVGRGIQRRTQDPLGVFTKIGDYTSAQIDVLNASIAAGSLGPLPANAAVYNTTTSALWPLQNGVFAFLSAALAAGIRPGLWQATMEFSNPTAYTGSGSGSTFGFRRQVTHPFVGGRFVAYSAGAKPTIECTYGVGTVASAAPTVVASGFVVPTWGGGYVGPIAGSLWKGTPNANIIEQALSDPFVLAAVARSDGGSGYIAEGRVFVPLNATTVYSTAVDINSAAVELITAGGVAFSGLSKSGADYASTNQSGFTAVGTATNYIFGDLILFTDTSIYTVAAGGDSISKGQASTDGRSSEIKLACDALTVAGIANVNYLQHTRPGKSVDEYGPSDVNFIRTIRPNIFFYTPNSPNDSGLNNAATLNRTKNQLAAVKQACDDVGTRMVLCSSTPWAPFTAPQDAADQAYYVTLRLLAVALGVPFHDRHALTTNGASPSALLPGFGYPTGSANIQAHPNDTCYQFLSPYAQTIIRNLIGK